MPSPASGRTWRALESLHEERIRRGDFRAAAYSGYGHNQRLFDRFTSDFTQLDPTRLARFRKHGVARALSQVGR